jgi:hypothetical protein
VHRRRPRGSSRPCLIDLLFYLTVLGLELRDYLALLGSLPLEPRVPSLSDWGLNLGLPACKPGTQLLEPHLQSILL